MPRVAFRLGAGRAACWIGALGVLTACAAPPPPEPDPSARLPGGTTTNTLLSAVNAFSQPLENLADEHRSAFFSGNSLFNNVWVQAPSSTEARDGLGPLFNARSCSACHFKDGRGRPPLEPDEQVEGLLLRLSIGFTGDESVLPDPNYGGQLQPFALPDLEAEASVVVSWEEVDFTYPDGEVVTLTRSHYEVGDLAFGDLDPSAVLSPRVAPQMIGLGLLEAIPASRLEDLADPDDADGDGISGRLRWVENVETGESEIGRFGWKSEQPSIRQQAAAAFLGDLGITSPLFPDGACTAVEVDCKDAISGGSPEIEAGLFSDVERYSQLLAVPERRAWDDEDVLAGGRAFEQVGCAACHVLSHQTGRHPDVDELSDQTIWPHTDLLLHDLGPELADSERASLDAEWRTPPLWGIGLIEGVNGHQRLLHDGRADGVEAAILWHGGEAEAARTAFAALSASSRAQLLRYVDSL